MLTSTLPFDHFELFGLRQGLKMGSILRFVPFGLVKSGHYALVRHPLMTGFLIMAFCPLELTVGRLLIAGIIGLYIYVSIFLKRILQKALQVAVKFFEEPDLAKKFGSEYETYQKSTPAFFPCLFPSCPLSSKKND